MHEDQHVLIAMASIPLRCCWARRTAFEPGEQAVQEDMMSDQDACGRGRLANVADACKVGWY